MAAQQICPYSQSQRAAQNLRSGAWPAEVITSEQVNDLRCPIYREATLNVLSPEFARGVALAFLAKQGKCGPQDLRASGREPGVFVPALGPPGSDVLADAVAHFAQAPEFCCCNRVRDGDAITGACYASVPADLGPDVDLRPPVGYYVSLAVGPPLTE
eukprot:10944956-Alexandrium_andersonii.AAC.1